VKAESHARQGKTVGLAFAALGVVYGDIGTSPLYALRETLSEQHNIPVTETSVVGVLSLIFWSLILVIAVKYVTFVMRADNHGEGGILALTSLITPRNGATGNRRWLVLLGLFGTALLYGDGAITPAISVLSAVEGIEVVTPTFTPFVIPIAIAILIGLFAIQHRGTGTVGRMFGPIMVVWFFTLTVLGVVHLADAPQVFRALNPAHAIGFFTTYTSRAFVALGSVFLVVTGGEALYADMGHFGPRPIRLGWFTMVMPALLIHYFGQGALLLSHPESLEQVFFLMAPEWARIPLVILATFATIIASQALISGVFSLTLQAVQLGYSPRVRIAHTSETERGQVYLASVNWILMAACIGLVLGFRSSAHLAAAYGVAVTATMVITAILFGVLAHEHWRWSTARVVTLVGAFLVIDLAFFGANLLKIPAGGWFPLVAGLLVFLLLTTWKRGRELVYRYSDRGRQPLGAVIENLERSGAPRVPGTAVYMTPNPGEVPPAFLANLRANHVLHEDVVFLSVKNAEIPHVLPAERDRLVNVTGAFHQLTLTYGFMDEPNVPVDIARIMDKTVSFDPDHTTYFLARETVRATSRPGMSIWRERLFAALHRNATSAAEYFQLPAERTVAIGDTVEI
jgi:KUP system potassium uptake protein